MKLKFVDILVCDSIKPLHLQTLRLKSKKKRYLKGISMLFCWVSYYHVT